MSMHEEAKPHAGAPSRTRDHLANERTFLAWIRTGLALIGLGFVLARMGLFLRQLAAAAALEHAQALHGGREFMVSGLVFLLLGTALCGWACGIYRHTQRQIDSDRYEPAWGAVVGLTIVMILGGLVITGLVIWRTLGSEGV